MCQVRVFELLSLLALRCVSNNKTASFERGARVGVVSKHALSAKVFGYEKGNFLYYGTTTISSKCQFCVCVGLTKKSLVVIMSYIIIAFVNYWTTILITCDRLIIIPFQNKTHIIKSECGIHKFVTMYYILLASFLKHRNIF